MINLRNGYVDLFKFEIYINKSAYKVMRDADEQFNQRRRPAYNGP